MRTLKKYLWVILFNALTAALIFVPVGLYAYTKFGFSSEAVSVGSKVSVIGIFFLVIIGIYMLSAVKHWIKRVPNWILRYVLKTIYSVALAGGAAFLIVKLCDTVDALAETALQSITDLTAAITFLCFLFMMGFLISRVSVYFSCLFMSKIEDMATLKKTERAQKEIEKIKAKQKKKRKEVIYD